MNHAWTVLTSRASCITQGSSRQPLLQLFNGYSKKYTSPSILNANELLCSRRVRRKSSAFASVHRQCFSIGVAHHARSTRQKYQPKSNTKILSSSKTQNVPTLETAPSVASHSEGQSAEEVEDPLTWRDYDPVGGMPLPGGELPETEISRIFESTNIDADTGNYVLSVMHWRRMSGALIDSGLDFPKDSTVSRTQALQGLTYVRSLSPDFDEQAAGEVWAEEESQRMEAEIQERAIKLGIYKRNPEDVVDVAEEPQQQEESQQGTEYGRQKSGQSVLEERRRFLDAKYERELEEKAAAEAKAEAAAIAAHRGPLELEGGVQPSTALTTTGATGIGFSQPQTKAWLQPVERKAWVKYYEERAALIQKDGIPQLSLLRRLGPGLLMVLATISFAIFVSNNYTPAPSSARIWPDTPPSVATLAGLTGTLVSFFVLSRMPPLWRTMSKYFTILPAYPRSISLLGASLRHDTLSHLVSNVVTLWLFGLLLHEEVGRGTFLSLYFASGAVGGYASLVQNVLLARWNTYIFGSSGCVFGLLGAICTLRPNATVSVAGYEIPIATWFVAVLYGVGQVASLVLKKSPNIDHVGHLGGLLAGIAGGVLLRVTSQRATPSEPVSKETEENTATKAGSAT